MTEPTGQQDAVVAPTTQQEQLYGAEELFFSTTDSQGRIRRANSTFMRLSGYPRGSLVGRAHNVVRHPSMPAGVYRCLWEGIQSGQAVSAYVTNQARDGGFYRVFATIVPSQGGYLSVRTLPMLGGLREGITSAYERVRGVEAASQAAGSTHREVAAAGEAALLEELRALGYKDFLDFTQQTLPEEVAALVASGLRLPQAPQAQGPVAEVLDAMNQVEDSTAGLVRLLDECSRLVVLLRERAAEIDALSDRLTRLREALRVTADDLDRLTEPEQAVSLRTSYEQVDAMVLECAEQLHPLSGQVEELRGDVSAVRFSIALMRLHNLAAGLFALQVLQGQDDLDANDAVGSMGELVGALNDGVGTLSQRLELFGARAELVSGELDAVAEELSGTHQPLVDLVTAACEAGADQEPVRTVASLVHDGFPQARDLAALAVAVRDMEIPYEPERILAQLARVREALTELA